MATLKPSPAVDLPPTLDWYRQAANWLVGLSTGAIAAGVTMSGEIRQAAPVARGLVFPTGLAFLLAVVSGVLFYFWILKFANSYERRTMLRAQHAAESDPAKCTEIEKKIAVLDRVISTEAGAYLRFYRLLLGSFLIGVSFLAVTLFLLVMPGREAVAGDAYQLMTVPVAENDASVGVQTVLVDRRNGRTWMLVAAADGTVHWAPIPTLAPPRLPAAQPTAVPATTARQTPTAAPAARPTP